MHTQAHTGTHRHRHPSRRPGLRRVNIFTRGRASPLPREKMWPNLTQAGLLGAGWGPYSCCHPESRWPLKFGGKTLTVPCPPPTGLAPTRVAFWEERGAKQASRARQVGTRWAPTGAVAPAHVWMGCSESPEGCIGGPPLPPACPQPCVSHPVPRQFRTSSGRCGACGASGGSPGCRGHPLEPINAQGRGFVGPACQSPLS